MKQIRKWVDEAGVVLVPAVVICEVYKIIRRQRTQVEARAAVAKLSEYQWCLLTSD